MDYSIIPYIIKLLIEYGVRKDKKEDVLRECRSGITGGHYVREVTTRNVLERNLW